MNYFFLDRYFIVLVYCWIKIFILLVFIFCGFSWYLLLINIVGMLCNCMLVVVFFCWVIRDLIMKLFYVVLYFLFLIFVLINTLWILDVEWMVWVFCMFLNSGIVILFFMFSVIVIVYVWVRFLFRLLFMKLMWYLVIFMFFGSFFFILLEICRIFLNW